MAKWIVVGKNSYVGGRFEDCLTHLGVTDCLMLSSADCNFLDRSAVERFFGSLGSQECVVLFLAAINKWVDNSYESFVGNTAMVRHLIEGAQKANIQSVLFASSVDVYGAGPRLPLTEESPIRPDTWYGMAKYVCEWMLMSAGGLSCPVTVLRIPGIYGPARNDRSLVRKMVNEFLQDRPVPITGGGRVLRDYLFVDDLCRLMRDMVSLKYRGVVNAATGHSMAVADMAQKVGEALHVRSRVESTPGNPGRDFDLKFDTSRLQSLLPKFRFTDMAEALRSYTNTASIRGASHA